MSGFYDFDRKLAEGYHARLSAAAYALGNLEATLQNPEWSGREDMLAEAAADLRVALVGSDEELVELEARRVRHRRELLAKG